MRRLRPTGCHPVYWLLCLSVIDRGGSTMSVEVARELLAEALEPDEVGRVLGDQVQPGR